MDKNSRRDAIRQYKERKVPIGIFAIRCRPTGETWVGASRNLDGSVDRLCDFLPLEGKQRRYIDAIPNDLLNGLILVTLDECNVVALAMWAVRAFLL